MILNKKGFMMLPLAALLFATSCGKNVSYKEAVKFVNETYTDKTPRTPKSGTLELQGKANDETIKQSLAYMVESISKMIGEEIKLDNNLYAKVDITPIEQTPLSEEGVLHALDGATGVDFTYTINGKNFKQSAHSNENDASTGIKIESWITEEYNDKGYLTKSYAKEIMKQGNLEGGLEETICWVY